MQAYCSGLGAKQSGMLLIPDSEEKMTAIHALIAKADNVTDDSVFLMGAMRDASGKWVYVNDQPMGQYENWTAG